MSEPRVTASAWAPFRHHAFALIWTATVVSNVGGWMYNVASGWLMTSLDPDPFIVSMVQVANSLPMFLFAIPAGALVDIVDRRLFLICGEFAIMITSAAFAVLVFRDDARNRPRYLRASGVWHDAERAELVAPFLHRDEGGDAATARRHAS